MAGDARACARAARPGCAYNADDDHGIVGAQAEITLDLAAGRPALRPRRRPRGPAAAGRRPAAAALRQQPRARRDPGRGLFQAALRRPAGDGHASPPRTRPARPAPARRSRRCCRCGSFYDPMAQALVEQRRDLLWSAANGPPRDPGAARPSPTTRTTPSEPARLSRRPHRDPRARRRDRGRHDAVGRGARRRRRGALAGGAADRGRRRWATPPSGCPGQGAAAAGAAERRQRRGDRPADGRAAPGDPRLHGPDGADAIEKGQKQQARSRPAASR